MGAITQNLSLGQFVKQLAALLQEKNIKLPFKDQRPWHLLFYELSKQPQKGRPTFFDGLVFDWDAPYPKCQDFPNFSTHSTSLQTCQHAILAMIFNYDRH